MLVSKNAEFCITPNTKPKICVSPNASQWNIGCVGSQTQISHTGHVHLIFFVLISFLFGSQFPVEYGLTVSLFAWKEIGKYLAIAYLSFCI